ncbi:hypothetical protein RirG_076130 [Rhizophagus irregularis DAOM 197198w]|nr:hypothetical protein RirG_076130 [Rhizophagus irregularis DAOM 197198w]
MGKIIDYRLIDNHLNHHNLADIQESTKKHMINWPVSSKFFSLNSCNDSTCDQHSKDVSWKMKTSTNTLPTLDVLNRNFPDLIKDNINCMLCHNNSETNDHDLWKCPSLLPHIRSAFQELAILAQDILHKDADKLNLCITDTIKYSNVFCWSLNDIRAITDNVTAILCA